MTVSVKNTGERVGKEIVQLYIRDAQTGTFDILIGKSSQDIVLKASVEVESTVSLPVKYHRNTTIGDLVDNPLTAEKAKQFMGRFGLEAALGDNPDMLIAMMRYMPLRALIGFGQGKYTEEMLTEDLKELSETR